MIQLYIGPPGTGKSYLLKELASEKENPIILAPTWYCAEKINGRTLYNYCRSSYIKFNPKKFNSQYVFIDEIFMFSKKEMERVLMCKNDDTQFFLFGDPFQIKSPNDDGYFWEALDQEPKVTYLTTYYRSQDDIQLQQLLTNYRIQKKIQITNQFQLVSIKEAVKIGATILVGTHQIQTQLQGTISKILIHNSIYGQDGNLYRTGQTLFVVSKYGSIQDKVYFERFEKEKMIVKQNDKLTYIEPIKKSKLTYPIIYGDVMTVNIAQGQEFDKIIIDSASFFEFGSLYTGLSRTHYMKDIYILNRKDYDKVFEADMENKYCFRNDQDQDDVRNDGVGE